LVHLWASIDAGKAHHNCVVIDADGNLLLSQKIPNEEPVLLQFIASVLELADGDQVVWAKMVTFSVERLAGLDPSNLGTMSPLVPSIQKLALR
jgi:Transposase